MGPSCMGLGMSTPQTPRLPKEAGHRGGMLPHQRHAPSLLCFLGEIPPVPSLKPSRRVRVASASDLSKCTTYVNGPLPNWVTVFFLFYQHIPRVARVEVEGRTLGGTRSLPTSSSSAIAARMPEPWSSKLRGPEAQQAVKPLVPGAPRASFGSLPRG